MTMIMTGESNNHYEPQSPTIELIERKLLLIEDEAMLVRTFTRAFNRKFGEVLVATGYDDALEKITKQLGPHDVVLSDYHLKGPEWQGTGLDLAIDSFEIRRANNNPMSIMSGGATHTGEHYSIIDAVAQGVIASFVEKPFSANDFCEFIKTK